MISTKVENITPDYKQLERKKKVETNIVGVSLTLNNLQNIRIVGSWGPIFWSDPIPTFPHPPTHSYLPVYTLKQKSKKKKKLFRTFTYEKYKQVN